MWAKYKGVPPSGIIQFVHPCSIRKLISAPWLPWYFLKLLQVEWWSHLWLCCFPSCASPTPQRWATGAASLYAVWLLCSELCGSSPKTFQLNLLHINLMFWPFTFPFFPYFFRFFHSEGGLSPQPVWIINLSNYSGKDLVILSSVY